MPPLKSYTPDARYFDYSYCTHRILPRLLSEALSYLMSSDSKLELGNILPKVQEEVGLLNGLCE